MLLVSGTLVCLTWSAGFISLPEITPLGPVYALPCRITVMVKGMEWEDVLIFPPPPTPLLQLWSVEQMYSELGAFLVQLLAIVF